MEQFTNLFVDCIANTIHASCGNKYAEMVLVGVYTT